MDIGTIIYNALLRAASPKEKLNGRQMPPELIEGLRRNPDVVLLIIQKKARERSRSVTSIVEAPKQFPNCYLTIGYKWHAYNPIILIGFGEDGKFITENEVEQVDGPS